MAMLSIMNLTPSSIYEGSMQRRAVVLVLEWASLHRAELLEVWN